MCLQVRLYAPSDRVNQTQFALEVAVTAVDLYTEMFNVSYPLPKLGNYINNKNYDQTKLIVLSISNLYITTLSKFNNSLLFVGCRLCYQQKKNVYTYKPHTFVNAKR